MRVIELKPSRLDKIKKFKMFSKVKERVSSINFDKIKELEIGSKVKNYISSINFDKIKDSAISSKVKKYVKNTKDSMNTIRLLHKHKKQVTAQDKLNLAILGKMEANLKTIQSILNVPNVTDKQVELLLNKIDSLK